MTPRSRSARAGQPDRTERSDSKDRMERSDSKDWPVRRAESYGGVVIRPGEDGPEVALIRTHNLKGDDVWTLPKGGADDGEDGPAAALREVREETGLEAEIIQPLEAISYFFIWPPEKVRYRKTVHLFLMRALGGDTSDHDGEVEEVRFFPLSDARKQVKYATDKKVLRALRGVRGVDGAERNDPPV